MIRALIALALAGAVTTPAVAAQPNGEALFKRECAICHLKDGTGTFMLARRLGDDSALIAERKNLTVPYVKRIVRYGINSMPRFTRAELPDPDLDAVATYLTRNAQGAAP